MNDNLTLDALLEAKNKLTTTLYYATSDLVEKGSVFIVENDHTYLNFPKYFVCSPDDLNQIRENSPAIKFIHLSEAPMQVSQLPIKYKTR